jgi:hypothetical protein
MVIICGIAWWFHPGNHLRNPSFGVLLPIRYPVGLEFSLSRAQGNIYALFHLGGYISYFYPQLKTHQDGRSNILFPLEAVAENMQAAGNHRDFARVTSAPVEADFVLSQNDESLLPELASQDRRYVIEDADQFFLLFRRGGGRYPVATELLARPQCWVADKAETLQAELSDFLDHEATIPDTFSKQLRGLSLVEALHRAVLALEELEVDGAVFPPGVEMSFRKHYRVARTLAWVAGSRSMHKTAVALFEQMSDKWYRNADLQAYAASLIAAGLAESRRERLLQINASEEATSDFSARVIGALDAKPNPRAVFACKQSSDGLVRD